MCALGSYELRECACMGPLDPADALFPCVTLLAAHIISHPSIVQLNRIIINGETFRLHMFFEYCHQTLRYLIKSSKTIDIALSRSIMYVGAGCMRAMVLLNPRTIFVAQAPNFGRPQLLPSVRCHPPQPQTRPHSPRRRQQWFADYSFCWCALASERSCVLDALFNHLLSQ